jgi:hypothetical protein
MEKINNKIQFSGKLAFNIFLNIANDFNILFIKQDFYNTSNYNYFFTSERINKIDEILTILKRKTSLKTAYMTLNSIKELRLSFFFCIKDYECFYGFYNEDNRYIYKVGKFKIYKNDFKEISKNKCMKPIRNIINRNNIKNLKELQNIKNDFYTLFDIKSEIEILDEFRIKNTFKIEYFNEIDRNEKKLRIFLTQWSIKFKWSNKCYYYINITEKYIHFYIKLTT